MLHFITAGESHGMCLTAMIQGLPQGLKISKKEIDFELKRRQKGYGRGGRMTIEKDACQIISGLKKGRTDGSLFTLTVKNRDFKINELPAIKHPRPGHADLAGALKYNTKDIRDILERASARETAARVAAGSVFRQLLCTFKVTIASHVYSLGGIEAKFKNLPLKEIQRITEESSLRCLDKIAEKKMMNKIDEVKQGKDTLGGKFEILVQGLKPGLGNTLDADIAASVMSIQAVKAVSIEQGILKGQSTGKVLKIRAAMKPISTLMRPLKTVHIDSKKPAQATVERSDVTAVSACGVIAESMVAFELAKCYLDDHR